MAITKQKKKEIVDKAADVLKGAEALVFVNFHGLKVADTTTLRKELKSKGVNYLVAKKTLLKRAFATKALTGEMPQLDGEIAIAYSADLLAPAREIYVFEKKFKDNVKIVGGVFEGAYADREKMVAIATIPSQQVLYAQFVNLINSPIQRLVIGLSQIAEKKGTVAA
jgi:large subunit ribosomal protein L10